MAKRSAGLLMFRRTPNGDGEGIELFLAHPGGPFWAKKDDGAWSIPKGLLEDGEDELAAARREFAEETGCTVAGDAIALGDYKQPGGKVVVAFAVEGDCDPAGLRSNTFTVEWPPRSGRMREFPEVDRAGWFSPADALRKLLTGQRPIVAALLRHLGLPSCG
jgi:predicted NUDIX family NTP pyrophosphohydrolase